MNKRDVHILKVRLQVNVDFVRQNDPKQIRFNVTKQRYYSDHTASILQSVYGLWSSITSSSVSSDESSISYSSLSDHHRAALKTRRQMKIVHLKTYFNSSENSENTQKPKKINNSNVLKKFTIIFDFLVFKQEILLSL